MRRILVDRARRRQALRRGGDLQQAELDDRSSGSRTSPRRLCTVA
jgi:hypothetical protein